MRWPVVVSVTLVVMTGCTSESVPHDSAEPSPTVHEFVGSPSEYTDALMDCMRGRGWQVTETEGGFGAGVDRSNEDKFIADMNACRDAIGAEPMADLSTEQLRSRYEWRRAQYDCLVDHGFATGAPLSFQSFVDRYERTGRAYWDPIAPLAEDGQDVQRANRECPYSTDEW